LQEIPCPTFSQAHDRNHQPRGAERHSSRREPRFRTQRNVHPVRPLSMPPQEIFSFQVQVLNPSRVNTRALFRLRVFIQVWDADEEHVRIARDLS